MKGKAVQSIRVMVTGVGGGGVGEQIVKSLRLAHTPYEIIGCDMRKTSMGLKAVDVPYIVPPASDPHYIDVIVGLCKKHEVRVLFYGSEPELKVFSENRELFESEGILVPLNPMSVIDICMDKNKTMKWFRENNFNHPKSELIRSTDDLESVNYYPVVLKPSVGGGGSVNAFIAQDERELLFFGSYLLSMYKEFIAQEYVGRYDEEYTVGVMCDYRTGAYVNSIAVKKSVLSGLSNKLRVPCRTNCDVYGEYLVISNGISQGEIGRFPVVTSQCRRIADRIGARGPINIQCRLVDGEVYVFEINPRISGTASLRALVGYNEPDMLIRSCLLGEEIERDFEYDAGYIARGLSEVLMDASFVGSVETADITDGA